MLTDHRMPLSTLYRQRLGDEDAVALYSESDEFVRFFTRYYTLVIDWAKKPDV
ncbi:MAG: hypothetical protein ABR887_07325 [Methanoregulaceae archaeon]|jgi:hypothetical protein